VFLKTLTLKGFKSFADSTSLRMEPGVTVVVGPNGSGKSNVVDAIGWVLGAQAPSAVRSQKMDDVIFAGTAKRQALGRAEVALTIDNSAGQLPIEFNEVTITRTLFRSGDSEYSINGVPCRLLDVQELLSDSGVGRQQHVIISQGQIDAVLNARPEDRRLIIEEAAGVLKYRRRKEKAERRLASTEGNLTRLEDLQREVRRQLRPLEKQADAARRHQGLVDELRALRVHLSGRDVARLRERIAQLTTRTADLTRRETELKAALGALDAQVVATEAELTAMGGHDLSDSLGLYESLREKARGQLALITERLRGVERERSAAIDQAVVATLEAEAAGLAAELAELESSTAELAPAEARLAEAQRELEAARERFRADWADGVAPPSGRAAEVRGELSALAASVARSGGELERIGARHDAAALRAARLAEELDRQRADAEQAAIDAPGLSAAIEAAAAELAHLGERAAEALAASRSADAEHASWSARAEALSSALDAARARAGAERLADVDGVVGTLLDVVQVDDGYQAAFESGAGEAIAAVVVDGVAAARNALEHLRADGVAGAVLALQGAEAPRPADQVPVPGSTLLRGHVRSTRPGVDGLLDLLVGSVVVADAWDDALDAVVARPGIVVVTRDGDRLGPSGWRVGQSSAGATGAALAEARSRSEAAEQDAATAAEHAATVRTALEAARDAEQEARRAVERADQRATSRTAQIQRLVADHADATAEVESLAAHLAELRVGASRDASRVAELEAVLPELEVEEANVAARAREMSDARTSLEERAAAVASLRSDLEVRGAGLTERREFLTRRSAEVEERLVRDQVQRREAEARRIEHDRIALALGRLHRLVTDRLEVLDATALRLRDRRRAQSEAARAVAERLEGLRGRRTGHERELEETRIAAQKVGLEAAEVRVRLEQVVEVLRNELDTDPDAALAASCPELPEGVAPVARVREVDRELRLMGAINPLALEEFEAMTERHTFLADQLEDVKSSRRDLSKVIRSIDAEIISTFAAAYADVEANFVQLFEMLFPGGSGGLKLTEPDSPLTTGIEIEAKPSGKNVRKLSLLSGGERSLVALAYLFAVFRSRPSPFYVMDEVEAALDDVNLHRFLDLVHEFRNDAQLIIVSHQKRTMEAADCLYGVSMQPGGSSKVVSEKA
jgi:chromosome segregation protein